MTTELISMVDFRNNVGTLWKKSQEMNIKYLVMVHGRPVLEVIPAGSREIDDDWVEYTEENHKARLEAKATFDRGESLEIDFDKIKTPKDFRNLIENYEV